jgi:hypothetical protein
MMTPFAMYTPPNRKASVIAHCCMLRGGTTSGRLARNGLPSMPSSVKRTVTGSRPGFMTPRFARTSGRVAMWSTACSAGKSAQRPA